jgi:hypothetical protein
MKFQLLHRRSHEQSRVGPSEGNHGGDAQHSKLFAEAHGHTGAVGGADLVTQASTVYD